mmetsp:Transcript_46293/g.111414  ORF Transcript_46293/g.111414 Transcript_46293/m.111414 type:complete len:208 (+) Transcript_46293:622-1245(+)
MCFPFSSFSTASTISLCFDPSTSSGCPSAPPGDSHRWLTNTNSVLLPSKLLFARHIVSFPCFVSSCSNPFLCPRRGITPHPLKSSNAIKTASALFFPPTSFASASNSSVVPRASLTLGVLMHTPPPSTIRTASPSPICTLRPPLTCRTAARSIPQPGFPCSSTIGVNMFECKQVAEAWSCTLPLVCRSITPCRAACRRWRISVRSVF